MQGDVAHAAVSPIDRIRAEQVRTLYRNAPAAILTSFGAAIAVSGALGYAEGLPLTAGAVFLAVILANTALLTLLVRRYRRVAPAAADWSRWARRFSAANGIASLCWGVGAVWLMVPNRFELQLLAVLAVVVVESGFVSAFGSHRPTLLLGVLSILLPPALWSASQGDGLHYGVTLLLASRIGFVWLVGRNINRGYIDSLRLRFENIELVDDLRRQKLLAEQASIAKSRLLASASHDLRQPVHALGLFVTALRQHKMNQEMRQVVEHIAGSVEALDDLFTALLDISRLDAGIIRSHPVAFAIQDVLDRICRDLAAEAVAKGVRLILHRTTATVETDPLLIERVLRNLISNAVRYTDHGRIVVGCRRGARLAVQIWDTGRGIPEDQRERIFQEFYRVANQERDHAKGLGLGLAIVRRLTILLDCPLTLRSEPGRGSVFMVAIPYATKAAQAIAAAEAPAMPGGGLILVIDDDPAIREAMRGLLSNWGYETLVAGSGSEMIEKLSTCSETPRLIISDYRLSGGDNGAAVIERLRSEFNEDIPAMLITGDTAPNRLREAQSSGFLLLHKPVASAKLRAAIGNLTRERRAEAVGL
jgi:signal transduction histidine kinase/ActR/RegA family two-component response regulator